MNFAQTEVNNVLTKYMSVWNGIFEQIKKNNGFVSEFGRDYSKIKVGTVGFEGDIDLPLNKLIKFSAMTVSFRLHI